MSAMSKPWQVVAFYTWLFGFLLIGIGLAVAAIGGMNRAYDVMQLGIWGMIIGAVVLVIGIAYRIGRRSYRRLDAHR